MLNVSEYADSLSSGKEIDIEYRFISDEDHQQIYLLLLQILGHLDRLFLTEVVSTILKELLMNANKANAKRIFFLSEGLNISDAAQYQRGIKRFQEEIIHRWDEQEPVLKGSNFSVRLRAKILNQNLIFLVENDCPLLAQESERIKARLESASKFNDLSEAFLTMSDSQESAGLGIVLIQLLLKNSGIGMDKFKIESDGKITRATLVIPKQIVPLEVTTKLKDRIFTEVEGLPPLPNTLTKIISLCNNADSDLGVIANEIERNPALGADLLKLSNSAGFASRNKVNTIVQAVKVVGLKNVRNLLYVSGVRKIMEGRYTKLQEVWNHSNLTSYLARQVSQRAGLVKLGDIAAAGALLHDLGKFVLLALDPNLFRKLSAFQKYRDLNNSTIFEEISIGISHPTLGGMLARKWDFPPDLVNMIEFHHRPFMAYGTIYADLVETVYLANMMSDYTERKVTYYAVDSNILRKFELDDKQKFEETCERLTKAYEIANEEN
ncbi:HDIG domain protein [Leptospira inadai serovar Lyme str. 10]|uniref:HDIG domain protein n=2 Tax=Leptospira inadai serovar Lyme TaxID=293084 RepID=V6HAX1_9LEPT|nr:HDOD domain-containing protein [Leptospira inadai]EQA36666.1 HDIG domain protein [Leptospira inadai serovar Lyme str. 10]PNV75783.1 HDOD domain-containing protein [Leptospira inadai serovar Lyme]